MNLIHRTFEVTTRAVGERSIRVIASTSAIDSYGEVVEQTWRLDRYRKNPVVLWGHNKTSLLGSNPADSLPIGYGSDVAVVGASLEATLNFVSEKANPMAERVLQGMREGSIRGVSVGFKPGSIEEQPQLGGGTINVLKQNELFEISVVAIPANPDAVAKMKSVAVAELRAFTGKAPAEPRRTAKALLDGAERAAERAAGWSKFTQPTSAEGLLPGAERAAERALGGRY